MNSVLGVNSFSFPEDETSIIPKHEAEECTGFLNHLGEKKSNNHLLFGGRGGKENQANFARKNVFVGGPEVSFL